MNFLWFFFCFGFLCVVNTRFEYWIRGSQKFEPWMFVVHHSVVVWCNSINFVVVGATITTTCCCCCCCCCFLVDLIRYVLFLLLLAYQIMFVYNQWYAIFFSCANAKMCLILNLSWYWDFSAFYNFCLCFSLLCGTNTYTFLYTVCLQNMWWWCKFMHVENALVKWIMHNV